MHPVPASTPTPASSGRGEGGGVFIYQEQPKRRFLINFHEDPLPESKSPVTTPVTGTARAIWSTLLYYSSTWISTIQQYFDKCFLLLLVNWTRLRGGGYGRKNVEWITRPGHVTTHFSCYCYLRLWMSYRLQNGNTQVYISVIDQHRL